MLVNSVCQCYTSTISMSGQKRRIGFIKASEVGESLPTGRGENVDAENDR